jgi:hypothetical protein
VDATELRPGLWRWTAPHPNWRPDADPGSPADWPPDVGCVACRTPGALVFIDPLVPGGAEEEFWAWADGIVRDHGEPVVVLTTIRWHRRSRDELAARYGASTSRARAALPRGVELFAVAGAGERLVWLAEHRALVPGDLLLADPSGPLRLCPESWLDHLGGDALATVRERMAPLLDLPVEMVLVSHGEPVLEGGAEALAGALR